MQLSAAEGGSAGEHLNNRSPPKRRKLASEQFFKKNKMPRPCTSPAHNFMLGEIVLLIKLNPHFARQCLILDIYFLLVLIFHSAAVNELILHFIYFFPCLKFPVKIIHVHTHTHTQPLCIFYTTSALGANLKISFPAGINLGIIQASSSVLIPEAVSNTLVT